MGSAVHMPPPLRIVHAASDATVSPDAPNGSARAASEIAVPAATNSRLDWLPPKCMRAIEPQPIPMCKLRVMAAWSAVVVVGALSPWPPPWPAAAAN